MSYKAKSLKFIILFLATFTLTANAGIISLGNGNVTSDTDSELIIDHVNQREYLRFDVLGRMTIREQFEVTRVGEYSSFTVANHQINFDFISALLDTKTGSCTATRNENGYCNKLSANQDSWEEGDLGFSYRDDADYWLFENQQDGAFRDFGLAGILKNSAILSFQNWSTLKNANTLGVHATSRVHFLLYRDINNQPLMNSVSIQVPEPSSMLIFLLASGLISMRRYIKS